MQQSVNPLYRQMFEHYNTLFAAAYDQILNDEATCSRLDPQDAEAALRNLVSNDIQNWADQPISSAADALTGNELIEQVLTLDQALELAWHSAVFCDDEMPDLVKIRLGRFGRPLIDGLLATVLTTDFSLPSDSLNTETPDLAVCAEYLKLLGDWSCTDCLEPILNRFAATANPNEMLADAVRYFLTRLSEQALPGLLGQIRSKLSADRDLDAAGEYLLISLTDIGKEQPAEEIFTALRDAFRAMSHKAIGAICLGDYGDGRAVATLRGWLERHPEVDDRQTVGEILSAIKRLGGETADLRHRLKAGVRLPPLEN